MSTQGNPIDPKELDYANGSMVLGQFANGSSTGFIGELSLAQLYNGSMAKEEVYQLMEQCNPEVNSTSNSTASVNIRWTSFTTVDMYNQAVMAIYPGLCSTGKCSPNSTDCSAEQGLRAPPVVMNCPKSQYLVTELR